MDGHQFRGARIHRDMMLVSSVCRRALGCEWGGVTNQPLYGLSHSSTRGDETAPAPSLHSEDRSDGMMTREGMAGDMGAACSGDPALPVRGSGGGL